MALFDFLTGKNTQQVFEISYVDFSKSEEELRKAMPEFARNNAKVTYDETISDNDLFKRQLELKKIFQSHLESEKFGKFAGFDNQKEFDEFNEKLFEYFRDLGIHPKRIGQDLNHVVIGVSMHQGFEGRDPLSFETVEDLQRARKAPLASQELVVNQNKPKEMLKEIDISKLNDDQKRLFDKKQGYKLTISNLKNKLAEIESEAEGEEGDLSSFDDQINLFNKLIEEAKEKKLLVEIELEEELQKDQEQMQDQEKEQEQMRIREFLLLEEKKRELEELANENKCNYNIFEQQHGTFVDMIQRQRANEQEMVR